MICVCVLVHVCVCVHAHALACVCGCWSGRECGHERVCVCACVCVLLDACMLEKKRTNIIYHVEHLEIFDVVGVDSHQLIIPHHQRCLIWECISHPL